MSALFWLFNLILLLIIGFFVGVPAGLSYNLSPLSRIVYIALLMLAVILFITGIVKRKHWVGKTLIVAGLLLWAIMGFIGLQYIINELASNSCIAF